MADSYSRWVMTDAFANNSQAAINAGQKIEWVSIKTSDDSHTFNDLSGFNDTTLATATIRQTTNISSVTITGKTVTITGLFNSNNNTADYYIRTMFLVARYNGKEFLAGATVANSSATAFRMPAASGTEITEFTARPQISVSNTSTISATVNPVASATNERVDGLEADMQGKINAINADKQKLWNKLAEYVTKTTAETVTGVKTFTQTIVGSITGNAGTATKLQTGRRINGTFFDGTSDINVPAANDSDIVHKTGDESVDGRKTFLNKTAFNKTISGALETREAPFSDFNEAATHLQDYQGKWRGGYDSIANSPEAGWFIADVQSWSDTNNLGHFILRYTDHNAVWVGLAVSGRISWRKLAGDDSVVHLTGAEKIAGPKAFSDEITFNKQINGSLKTRWIPTSDLSILASDTHKYSGFWFVADENVANGPTPDITWGTVEVVAGNTYTTGLMKYTRFLNGETYLTGINGGIMGWYKVPKDFDIIHKNGDETMSGVKTFTSPINGALKTRIATFTDFSQVATNMESYAGNWVVKGGHIENSPVPDGNWMVVEVTPGDFGISGKITVTPYDGGLGNEGVIYYAVIKHDGVINWRKVAKDSDVIHNSGTENIEGDKNFTGNNTFGGITTINSAVSSNVRSKTIEIDGFVIGFRETALGVNVSITGRSVTALADSIWRKIGVIPDEITLPLMNVYSTFSARSTINSVSQNAGLTVILSFNTDREIDMKVTTLKDNDPTPYNVTFDSFSSVFWIK